MKNIWQGDRIKLRAVEASDLEEYFCITNQVADTDAQRNGDRLTFPLSKTMMRDRVEHLAKSNPFGEDYFMIIVDNDGKPVGNINSHSCSRIDGTFQYGVGIKNEYRGKGYATEAIKLLLRFYFMELGFQKVETRVYSFNAESIGLHEKLEFTTEGRLRRSHYALGSWHDVICFGMTREEFSIKYPDFVF